MRKSNAQSMGYWLNEPAILDPEIIVMAFHDLADSCYDIVRGMFCNYFSGSK